MYRVSDLLERHLLPVVIATDDVVRICLHSFLDETQQVFLIHARRRVHVRVHLQCTHLSVHLTNTWTSVDALVEKFQFQFQFVKFTELDRRGENFCTNIMFTLLIPSHPISSHLV